MKVSRKNVQQHINDSLYVTRFQLEVFTVCDDGINIQLRITGIDNGKPIEKVFKSSKGAKNFVTRLSNKELCRIVDARQPIKI